MTQSQIDDLHVSGLHPLPSPLTLAADVPMSAAAAETVVAGRIAIQDILAGRDPRLLLVVGPCSIHDEAAAMEYAERLRALADRVQDRVFTVMRVYFEKPRTTVGWKGLIYDPHLNGSFEIAEGLHIARRVLCQVNALGLPAGTEFLDPFVPQYLAGLVSWAAIGARTTESQTHRQMASGLSMPVGFKNSTTGDTQVAVDAVIAARSPHAFLGIDGEGRACIVETTGNPYGHIVLRGGKDAPNYDADAIAAAAAQLQAAGLRPEMIVDCSHANSNKDHALQGRVFEDVIRQRQAGNRALVGMMVESHLFPGNQKLGAPADMKYGVSITDACVGWAETEQLVLHAHEALAGIEEERAGAPA